jgi:acetyl esterase
MIDPDIQRFVSAVTAAYGQHPEFDSLPLARKRAVAEATRAPWCTGGPAMHQTSDERTRGLGVGVRIYDPGGRSPKPAIAYMHGGGWTFFGIGTHDRLMREYAARTGAVVIGVEYSWAPEATFPRQIEEIVDVVDWLRDDGAASGIDARRLALAGDSAGATLAIAAALALRDAGSPDAVNALVLNYGAFDADCTRASYQRFGDGSYLLSTAEMQWMWLQYLGSHGDRAHPLACPLHADLAGLPPCFLAIAESDILHDENVAMAERLHAAAVPTRATIYPGTVHGFLEAVAVARVSSEAIDDASRWLAGRFEE